MANFLSPAGSTFQGLLGIFTPHSPPSGGAAIPAFQYGHPVPSQGPNHTSHPVTPSSPPLPPPPSPVIVISNVVVQSPPPAVTKTGITTGTATVVTSTNTVATPTDDSQTIIISSVCCSILLLVAAIAIILIYRARRIAARREAEIAAMQLAQRNNHISSMCHPTEFPMTIQQTVVERVEPTSSTNPPDYLYSTYGSDSSTIEKPPRRHYHNAKTSMEY